MGGYPLPALHVNPPTPTESPIDLYGKLLQYKAMGQQAELRNQQIQAGQQENQVRAQQLKDAQTVMEAQAAAQGDPQKWLPAIQGKVSPQTWMALTKTDAETREQNAKASQAELALKNDKNNKALGLIDQAKNIPDEQWGQFWPQFVSALDDVKHEQVAKLGLTADQPQPKQILDRLGLGLQTQEQYIKQAQEDRAKQKAPFEQQKAEADAATAQSESQIKGAEAKAMQQYGGLSPQMADSRYRSIQQKLAARQMISPDDQNFVKAYEKQKLLVPVTTANIKMEGMGQNREYPVINKQTGELEMRSAADINKSPGVYAPAGEGAKAMGKTALIEDIRGNIQQVRGSLTNPKMPEFTASQRAEIAVALGGKDAGSALTAAFRGGVLGSLTPEQQEYLINLAQLKENAMAMRSVLGAGQGSDDMRAAITATIPGPRTPSKAYAAQQLDKFEAVLNRLGKGVPGMPLRGGNQPPNTQQPDATAKRKRFNLQSGQIEEY